MTIKLLINFMFLMDLSGADPLNRLSIRIITDTAWHSLFASQIFIKPSKDERVNFIPEFTLLSINNFAALPESDGTK